MVNRTYVVLIALIVALAGAVHYRMLALIAAGVLFLWTQRRWLDGVLFGCIASLPLLTVWGINLILAGTATGYRYPSRWTLAEITERYLRVIVEMSLSIGGVYVVCWMVFTVLRRIDVLRHRDHQH